jgi:hypothetical protein
MTGSRVRVSVAAFFLLALVVVDSPSAFADGVGHRVSDAGASTLVAGGFTRPGRLKADAPFDTAHVFANREALAETGGRSPRQTKAVWTIVGAAVGAGVGMWAGFRAFDQATYAERKITTATIAGGAIGGVVGWTIGWGRSRSATHPVTGMRVPGTAKAAPYMLRLRGLVP